MRRAQLSMFMIVGILLLLSTIFVVAIYQDWITFRPPERQVSCEIPTELKPLENVVRSCQEELARQATQQALVNGGYLKPEEFGLYATRLPQGNAIFMDEETLLPYWHYLAGGVKRSEMLPLQQVSLLSVAGQVAQRVDEQLDSCVPWDDFAQYNIERGTPRTQVQYNDFDTFVNTRWEMEVDVPECADKTYVNFESRFDSPVKKLYEEMEYIFETLSINHVPETITLSWLGVYANGLGDLPPIQASTEIGGDFTVYPLAAAENDLEEVASYVASTLVLEGAQGSTYVLSGSDAFNGILLSGIIPAKSFPHDFEMISYAPRNQGIHFLINDRAGAAIPKITRSSGIMQAFMPDILDNTFRYDVTYPLVIRLAQDEYVLNAAYEVNIDNGRAGEATILEDFDAEYCATSGGTNVSITLTPEDVEAEILYTCGSSSCALGSTTEGTLSAALPGCAQGNIEAVAEGLFSDPIAVASTSEGGIVDLEMEMHEPREVQIQLERRNVIRELDGNFTFDAPTQTPDGEILLIRQGTPYFARPDANGRAELVPGRYQIVVYDITDFDPPHEIEPWIISPPPDLQIVNGTEFESLPTLYLDISEDQAVSLSQLEDTLIIEAGGLPMISTAEGPRISGMDTYEEMDLLSALFELTDSSRKVVVDEGNAIRVQLVPQ